MLDKGVLTKIITNKGHNKNDPLSNVQICNLQEVTRRYYERRLKKFFDFIEYEITDKEIESKCNKFAEKAKTTTNWALSQIIRFLQYQKERVENKELHLEY